MDIGSFPDVAKVNLLCTNKELFDYNKNDINYC